MYLIIVINEFEVHFYYRTAIQNYPIPVKYPKEHHQGIWGGEGVIQGLQQRKKRVFRVPHFWFPQLKRSVIYSEVLDKYMSIVVTERAIRLIHEHFGFDHYLLKVIKTKFG